MEVFSQLIKYNAEKLGFDCHPRCKELKITHEAFVDDLLLIGGSTEKAFKLLKRTLDEFGDMSGLCPNLQKSCIFLSGIRDDKKVKSCAE